MIEFYNDLLGSRAMLLVDWQRYIRRTLFITFHNGTRKIQMSQLQYDDTKRMGIADMCLWLSMLSTVIY